MSVSHRAAAAAILSAVVVLAPLLLGAIGAVEADADGQVVSVTSPETVASNDTFEIVVNTNQSAGTVVDVDPEGGSVDLSSEADHSVVDNQIRFLDPAASDSEYVISVDYAGGTTGDVISVSTWVNTAERSAADDGAEKEITVSEQPDVQIVDQEITPSTINTGSSGVYDITFTAENVSTDGNSDELSITMPEGVVIQDVENVSVVELDSDPGVSANDNRLTVSIDPTGPTQSRDLNVTVEMKLSADERSM